MKASILIVSYLSKDIWHRWFENPGSFLSRLLVASLLGCLLLGVHLAFRYSEFLLEEQISHLGLHNVTINHYVSPAGAQSGQTSSVGPLLEELSRFGKVLHFKRLPGTAQIELAGNATVVVGDRQTLVAFAPWLSAAGPADSYILASGYPEGLPLTIAYEGHERLGRTVGAPRALGVLFGERPVVFLPELAPPVLEEQGYTEAVLLLGDPEVISALGQLVETISLLLEKEGFERAQVQSAANWLDDLEDLRRQQAGWSGWFGIFCGLLVALVYGSITALEYRQNAFLAALIRSFGVSPLFILLRYLTESAVLVILAAACATLILWAAAPVAGDWLELSSGGLTQLREELVHFPTFWTTMRWLCGGALLAILPVGLALRHPVGRLLG